MEAGYGCRIWVLNPQKGQENRQERKPPQGTLPRRPMSAFDLQEPERRLSSHTSKHTVFSDQDVYKNQYFYKFLDLSVNSTTTLHSVSKALTHCIQMSKIYDYFGSHC